MQYQIDQAILSLSKDDLLIKTLFLSLVSIANVTDVDDDNIINTLRDDTEDEVEEEEASAVCDISYLVNERNLEGIKVEQIEGDKPGSIWLLVDDTFVFHKYQGSELETFWECS